MPLHSRDTTPEVAAAQREVLGKMGGAKRVEMALEWSRQMRMIAMAGIRDRNPEFSARQVVLEYARMTLGERLFREAFAAEAALIDR